MTSAYENPDGKDVIFLSDEFPAYDIDVPRGERESAIAKTLEMQAKGFTAQAVGRMIGGSIRWVCRVSGWGLG